MPSLSRRGNEPIRFCTNDGVIGVTISNISSSQVKLAIAAPDCVNIVRAEIDDMDVEAVGSDQIKDTAISGVSES